MSVYQLNKLLYLTDNDPEFRKRMLADPEAALSEFKLPSEERDALTSGAVGKLYQMGFTPFFSTTCIATSSSASTVTIIWSGFAKACHTVRVSSLATCRCNDSLPNKIEVP